MKHRLACLPLMSAPHVGPLAALSNCATIDDTRRIAGSRAFRVYLGLTSRCCNRTR
jgi:transposase